MKSLVIGARGHVGGEVVRQLLAANRPVRASVRRRNSATFPAGVEVVAADLRHPETLTAALDGISDVFLYAPNDPVPFLTTAKAAGVDHVVLLSSGSVLLPDAADNAITRHHRDIEDAFANADLRRWTPIRPLVLATNSLNWAPDVKTSDAVRLVHPGGLTAPVHERDIAAVAISAMLVQSAQDGVSDMLTGPALISQEHQVHLIAAAIGRPLAVEELSEQQARSAFGAAEDPRTVDAILWFIASSTRGGSPASDTVERVLGRRPIDFAQWARDHAADFR